MEAEASLIAKTGLISSLVNLSLALRERGTDFYSGAKHGLVDLVLWSVVERLCLSGLQVGTAREIQKKMEEFLELEVIIA